jgi:hypothetical protein
MKLQDVIANLENLTEEALNLHEGMDLQAAADKAELCADKIQQLYSMAVESGLWQEFKNYKTEMTLDEVTQEDFFNSSGRFSTSAFIKRAEYNSFGDEIYYDSVFNDADIQRYWDTINAAILDQNLVEKIQDGSRVVTAFDLCEAATIASVDKEKTGHVDDFLRKKLFMHDFTRERIQRLRDVAGSPLIGKQIESSYLFQLGNIADLYAQLHYHDADMLRLYVKTLKEVVAYGQVEKEFSPQLAKMDNLLQKKDFGNGLLAICSNLDKTLWEKTFQAGKAYRRLLDVIRLDTPDPICVMYKQSMILEYQRQKQAEPLSGGPDLSYLNYVVAIEKPALKRMLMEGKWTIKEIAGAVKDISPMSILTKDLDKEMQEIVSNPNFAQEKEIYQREKMNFLQRVAILKNPAIKMHGIYQDYREGFITALYELAQNTKSRMHMYEQASSEGIRFLAQRAIYTKQEIVDCVQKLCPLVMGKDRQKAEDLVVTVSQQSMEKKEKPKTVVSTIVRALLLRRKRTQPQKNSKSMMR